LGQVRKLTCPFCPYFSKDRKGLWDRLGYQVSFPSENLVALPLNRSNKKYKQENTNNINHYFLKGNNYLF